MPLPPNKLTKISGILESTLKNYNLQETFRVYPIWKKWEEIMGPTIAVRSKPDFVREGVLTVSVEHPVWLTELQAQKPLLLKKLENLKLDPPLRDIQFRLNK